MSYPPQGPQYPYQQPPPPGGPPQPPRRRKTHTTRNVLLLCAGAVLVLVIIAAAASGGHKGKTPAAASATSPATSSASSAPAASTPAKPAAKAAARQTVTYVVTGSPGASVTYGPEGSSLNGHVPMHVTASLANPQYYSISAQLNGGGAVSCRILVDGKVLSRARATGGYNIAQCEIVQSFSGGWQGT